MTSPANDSGSTVISELVERLRAWGENDADPAYFQGDVLSCVLLDCGQAAEAITQLLARIDAAERGGLASRLWDKSYNELADEIRSAKLPGQPGALVARLIAAARAFERDAINLSKRQQETGDA